VVCNDSGLMHLATSTDLPIVTIFGSSVKEFGFIPNSDKAILIENLDIKCRPCSHIGKDFCPKKHFNCMKTIKPEKVLSEISSLENLL
ncbi:glycosyltransferase family 9 protein, partial [Arthrospira platensis SPKY1]|nr:glycosyltransferase family 9 protein [Arthrospira platensis SPKY1]